MTEAFETYTGGILKEIDTLKETETLLAFTTRLAEIAPKLREWSERFESMREADTAVLSEVARIGEQFDSRLKDALAHQTTLKSATSPAAGGKRWKMPRKMTRRYCRKTACRKMGFTQKASCRPWKNCY